jgi:hypothetical protein
MKDSQKLIDTTQESDLFSSKAQESVLLFPLHLLCQLMSNVPATPSLNSSHPPVTPSVPVSSAKWVGNRAKESAQRFRTSSSNNRNDNYSPSLAGLLLLTETSPMRKPPSTCIPLVTLPSFSSNARTTHLGLGTCPVLDSILRLLPAPVAPIPASAVRPPSYPRSSLPHSNLLQLVLVLGH